MAEFPVVLVTAFAMLFDKSGKIGPKREVKPFLKCTRVNFAFILTKPITNGDTPRLLPYIVDQLTIN